MIPGGYNIEPCREFSFPWTKWNLWSFVDACANQSLCYRAIGICFDFIAGKSHRNFLTDPLLLHRNTI